LYHILKVKTIGQKKFCPIVSEKEIYKENEENQLLTG
jgi:hypothetical protein